MNNNSGIAMFWRRTNPNFVCIATNKCIKANSGIEPSKILPQRQNFLHMQVLLKCVNYKQKEATLELGGFKMRVYKPMPSNDRLSF